MEEKKAKGPIKCVNTCLKCFVGYGCDYECKDCIGGYFCEAKEQFCCGCLSVKDGEPCPYFK